MPRLPFIFLLLVGCFLSATKSDRKVPTYTLEEAMAKRLIKLLDITYAGDKSLHLKLEHTHKRKDIQVRIKTGQQFTAQDTSEQDQIVLKERTLLVKAGSRRSYKIKTYCTQADHLSPGQGSTYTLQTDANGKLLRLAEFLSKLRGIEYTSQQAIWVLTNDHDLKGLFHEDPNTATAIQDFVADLTGKEKPVYTVRYKDSEERQPAFRRESILIQGVHEYELSEAAIFSCKIYSEAGEEVKEVFKEMRQGRGQVRFSFQLQTTRLPKGRYVSRVFKGDEVFHEIWIES